MLISFINQRCQSYAVHITIRPFMPRFSGVGDVSGFLLWQPGRGIALKFVEHGAYIFSECPGILCLLFHSTQVAIIYKWC